MNEAHIIQIPELDIFLAHGHDEESHMFIENMMCFRRHEDRVGIMDEHAVFPLEYLSWFRFMAGAVYIDVVEGEE